MTPADERQSELETTPIWQLTQPRFQFLKGVKQPHIMEISLVQMARFSKRGKDRYQQQRAAEWDASGNCKVEYNRLVWEAYQRGEFTEQSEGVTDDARKAVYYGKREAKEQDTAERMKAAQIENVILSVNDAELGDTVYALYGSRYVKIVGKYRTSFKVQALSGGEPFTVKARACQWLHYNELVKAVEEGRPVNPHRAPEQEPDPTPTPAQAAATEPERDSETTASTTATTAPAPATTDRTQTPQGVTVERAEQLIRYQMETRGIFARGWSFKFDTARRRMGSCDYEAKCLTFSVPFIEVNDEAELLDTIKHEIAHILAGSRAGHGRIWRAHALALGCKPEACGGSNVVSPDMRYHAICAECGSRTNRDMLPRARVGHLKRTGRGRRRQRAGELTPCATFCSRCLDRHGRTRANFERFILSWVETSTGRAVEWPPKPTTTTPAPVEQQPEREVWTVPPLTYTVQASLF